MSNLPDSPVEVTLEDDQPAEVPQTPLGQTAQIMAALMHNPPDVEARAEGTRVYVTADGVTVLMNVLSVSADAGLVLQPE